jgi:hypothetical protein
MKRILGILLGVGVLAGVGSLITESRAPKIVAADTPKQAVDPDIANLIVAKMSDKVWLKSGISDGKYMNYSIEMPTGGGIWPSRLIANKAAWWANITGSPRRRLDPERFGGVREACSKIGPALTKVYYQIESGPLLGGMVQVHRYSDGSEQALLANAAYLEVDKQTWRCTE